MNYRPLTNSELNYSVTEKELLGIYYACKQTEVYLTGHDCVVYMDHKLPAHLKSFRDKMDPVSRRTTSEDKIRRWER